MYNLYSQTLFAGSQLTASQVVLLLQGILQGKTSKQLARELDLTEVTVLLWRHRVQAQAEHLQPETVLADLNTESDEMSQNAEKKGVEHLDPADPPGRRANKRRGRGTFAKDRPPVLGSVGRESSQVRLRVVKDTIQATLRQHVEQFTRPDAQVYTDDYASYNTIERAHATVAHGRKE